MQLSNDFWATQKGKLLVGETGELRFTAAGREFYAPLLAKYGFSISNVKTLEQFRDVMATVNAGELDENTQKLRRVLEDPNTSEEERAAIRRVLQI